MHSQHPFTTCIISTCIISCIHNMHSQCAFTMCIHNMHYINVHSHAFTMAFTTCIISMHSSVHHINMLACMPAQCTCTQHSVAKWGWTLNLINWIGNLIKQEADPYTQELPYYITDQITYSCEVKLFIFKLLQESAEHWRNMKYHNPVTGLMDWGVSVIHLEKVIAMVFELLERESSSSRGGGGGALGSVT